MRLGLQNVLATTEPHFLLTSFGGNERLRCLVLMFGLLYYSLIWEGEMP